MGKDSNATKMHQSRDLKREEKGKKNSDEKYILQIYHET